MTQPTIFIPGLMEYKFSLMDARGGYRLVRDIEYSEPQPENIQRDITAIMSAVKVHFYPVDRAEVFFINNKAYKNLRFEISPSAHSPKKHYISFQADKGEGWNLASVLTDNARKKLEDSYSGFIIDIYKTVLTPLRQKAREEYLNSLKREVVLAKQKLDKIDNFLKDIV